MDSPELQPTKKPRMLEGLSPEGLLDGVLGGSGGDWEPPEADEVEPWFSGYSGFAFIDRGSMGSVYAATQLSLDRRVAIKILPPELGLNPDFVTRFQREARLLAKLQHPHIVAIHDSGTTENGHAFIVMEFVQGTSLLDIMREREVPLAEALQISAQVAQALAFAHEHGVIHRDIKPTNILIDEWGRARVADFGLAKLVGQNWFDVDALSGTGAGLGTPGYAAPEQKRSDSKVDQRTDLFSLGITLRELVTGDVSEDPDDLSDLAEVRCPKFVSKLIHRSIQPNPLKRFQSATEMEAAIKSAFARVDAPPLPHKILQKPITATVIGIQLIVTTLLLSEKAQEAGWIGSGNLAATATPNFLPIQGTTLSILAERLNASQALGIIAEPGDRHLASLTAQEKLQVREELVKMGIKTPLWIASANQGNPILWTHSSKADESESTNSDTEAWALVRRHNDSASTPIR